MDNIPSELKWKIAIASIASMSWKDKMHNIDKKIFRALIKDRDMRSAFNMEMKAELFIALYNERGIMSAFQRAAERCISYYNRVPPENIALYKAVVKKIGVNTTDKFGRTMLMNSLLCRHHPSVLPVLMEGANLNIRDKLGNAIKHAVLARYDVRVKSHIITMLIQNGAKVEEDFEHVLRERLLEMCDDELYIEYNNWTEKLIDILRAARQS
jgi:hypothetical protein